MPKENIRGLNSTIKFLKEASVSKDRTLGQQAREIEALKKRLEMLTGENESLRMDKKWLQNMHSALLQSLILKVN